MTTLYDELLTLTADDSPGSNPEGAAAAIRTARIAGTPDVFRKEMCVKTARFIVPTIPDGMEYSKDCFWREFQAKFIWHRAWMGTDAQKESSAAWLRKERETAQRRGNVWPPKPTFRPAVKLPMPWDGRNEKAGRVPVDGKV